MCRTRILKVYHGNWIFLLAAVHLFTYGKASTDEDSLITFTAEPHDAIVGSGAAVALPCAARAAGGVRLSWRYRADGEPGPHDEVSRHDANRKQVQNGSLVVSGMGQPLAGYYQCAAAVDGLGRVLSRAALVTLAELPELIPGPPLVVTAAGSPALLRCGVRAGARAAVQVAGAAPPPRRLYAGHAPAPPVLVLNITWYKNGQPVAVDERASLSPSGALQLDPARAPDGGHYRCRVALLHDPDQYKVGDPTELRVSPPDVAEAAPRFVATPQSVTVIEGATVTLDCAATGNPRPEVTWLNNGAAIDLSDLDSRFLLSGSGSLVVVSPRQLDAGRYTCRAASRVDAVDASATLRVNSAPRAYTPVKVIKATASDDVVLRCEVRGRPAPVVRWAKDGEPLTPDGRDLAMVDGASLRISGVLSMDAGLFQCGASSPAGAARAALRLMVNSRENADTPSLPSNPKINSKSFFNSLKTDNGLLDDMSPLTKADYADQYDDLTDTKTDTPSPDYRDVDTEEEALFHAAQGIDLEGPLVNTSAPRNLRAVIVKHRFVTLSWEPADLPPDSLTGYVVTYRVKGSERARILWVGGGRQEVNVPALQPDTEYELVVRARTPSGASPPATLLVTTPKEEGPPPPEGVEARALGPHSMLVSWAGPPADYRVTWAEVDGSKEQSQWVRSATELVVGGLRAGGEYLVRVGAGGPPSAPRPVRTPSDAPAQPPANVSAAPASATSILVRWEYPPARSHRGQLTGFKLRYRPADSQSGPASQSTQSGQSTLSRKKADVLTVPADNTRAEIKGLERGTTYQIRVSAINANGSGPASDWVVASTLRVDQDESTVPGQPPPLTTRSGRDWISVWWGGATGGGGGVGGSGGGRVRGWALGWGLGVPDEVSRDLPATAHSHVIRELKPNSEYVISLRASNNLGLGPPVYATVRTAAPSGGDGGDLGDLGDDLDDEEEEEEREEEGLIPPLGVKVIMLSGTTAVVYWTDPTLPKGQPSTDGRRYVVRWAGGGRARAHNASDLSLMVDDLRPHTTYEFAVKMIKGSSESPWSMLVSNTSLEAPPGPPRDLRAAPAPRPPALDLTWAPPNRPNGVITGYVITYSEAAPGSGSGGGWTAVGVGASPRAARLERLRARTAYLLRVQARSAAGLGAHSHTVTVVTGEDSNVGAGLAGSTSAWLWASAGGAVAVLALAAALALSLCCRRTPPDPDTDISTYQKSSASTGIKPPDLWIHHDQMELKHLDKGMHSSASKISAGSGEGGVSCRDYEPARAQPASLDRRQYVPTYVDSRWSSACSDSDATAVLGDSRAQHNYTPMSGSLSTAGVGAVNTLGGMSALSGMSGVSGVGGVGGVGGCGGCERGRVRPPHALPHEQGVCGLSPQSSLNSLVQPPPAPCGSGTCPLGAGCGPPGVPAGGGVGVGVGGGGGDIYACAARERGHYVAYEPLGHYTHSSREQSASSESGGSLRRPPPHHHNMHSFTLPHDTGSIRESSPYKKSNNSSPGHGNNRLQMGGLVPHCPSELEPLTPSRSTERLQREMQNLEGLMKDLSAITQQQFHC